MTATSNTDISATDPGVLPVQKLAIALTALVALLHLAFLVLEMFFWNHPLGMRIFNLSPEAAASSAVLAANQGLYNGFLAAGLVWTLASRRLDLAWFFLGCVTVAGIFGGITAKPTIFLTQALPAMLALGAWVLAGKREPMSQPG